MQSPPHSGIDPSKVKGVYTFLGAFLSVTEGLLGYWLYLAESGIERGVAGAFMVVLLLAALFVVLKKIAADSGAVAGPIKPPKGEATEEQIEQVAEAPPAEVYAAPDRSYLINRPPEDWTISELTQTEWNSRPSGVPAPKSPPDEKREILVFANPSKNQASIIPIPGRTTLEGNIQLTALETMVPTQLAIIPFDRAPPPLYFQRTMETNVLALVGEILNLSIIRVVENLSWGTIEKSGRRYLSVALKQQVKDAIVNGADHQDAVCHNVFIGMQGELRDYLLVITFATVPGDHEIERDLKTLNALIASFRPLQLEADAEEQRKKIEDLATRKFNEQLADSGRSRFDAEFSILLQRVDKAKLDDLDERNRAIKQVKPFEDFARQIKLQNPTLDALWNALHEAEAGDAGDFKQMLKELIDGGGWNDKKQVVAAGKVSGPEKKVAPLAVERPPMIYFSCPSCHKSLKASVSASGKTTKCPTCGGAVPIPPAAATPAAEHTA